MIIYRHDYRLQIVLSTSIKIAPNEISMPFHHRDEKFSHAWLERIDFGDNTACLGAARLGRQ